MTTVSMLEISCGPPPPWKTLMSRPEETITASSGKVWPNCPTMKPLSPVPNEAIKATSVAPMTTAATVRAVRSFRRHRLEKAMEMISLSRMGVSGD